MVRFGLYFCLYSKVSLFGTKLSISYFAYPSTNGFKEMDYKLTDIYATPPETQKYFTEKFLN
jgi:predicted O-linked N-acetylglucosamine transferase (SPINDLY family)